MARAPGATTSSLSASGGRSSTRKSTSAPMPACPRRGTRSAAISPSTTKGVRIHRLAARRPIRHTSPRCSQSRPRHKQDRHPFSDDLDPVQRSRATSRGRPPIGLERMLRIHFLQQHELSQALYAEVSAMLEERGLLMRQGTIVDATNIAAPTSTENKRKARDPEMHQTRKGNQWHFGMKAHIGVDVDSGVVHTVVGTAANEADITQMAAVLHGAEEDVFADAGYTGADKRPEHEDRDVCWNIAIKRSIIKALPKGLRDLAEPVERALAQVRAWVEHPFHIVKNLFRHKKLRYRGLAKNTAQLHTLFALANLVIVKKTLLVQSRA